MTEPRWARRARRACWTLFVLACAWVVFAEATLLRPPRDLPPAPPHHLVRGPDGTLHDGRSYLRHHGGVLEMGLWGTPVELGDAHATLAHDAMLHVETRMMALFARYVPSATLRSVIVTVVRARNRHLDQNYPPDRLREIAAEARALAREGDPFASFLPTFHRMVTLHALYDISLSFEHSPLIGCTAFFAAGPHTRDGHTYVGRNFDMEIDPVFDTDKVVALYHPRGRIAFASVAWPGLSGVVTGMNARGIFVAIHGARAGEPSSDGVPVPTTVREVMERASTLDEAIAIIGRDRPMVSHRLLVVDGDAGTGAVIERAPGAAMRVERLGTMGAIANHFVDPTLARDPRNVAVRDATSTLARQTRADELLREHDGAFDPATVLATLRDRRGANGEALPLGDRAALDAWIATHSVIADASARVLWVSDAPHTLGSYERFDLRELLADEYAPGDGVQADDMSGVLPGDPALADGTYARFEHAQRDVEDARTRLAHHDAAGALAALDRARSALGNERMEDEMVERARVLTALGRVGEAHAAWSAVLSAGPASPATAREATAGGGR